MFMMTKYERELVDYYKNWKKGKVLRKPKINTEEPEVKETINVEINIDRLADEIQDRLWDIL